MTAAPVAIVAGSGVIGMASAAAIARRGFPVLLIGESRPGAASAASAGMLAPSVERAAGPAHAFAIAARDRYPSYVEQLAEDTGIRVPLNRLGVLQVALTERAVRGLQKTALSASQWMDRSSLGSAEPTLAHALGALWSPEDGSVDNVILLKALAAYLDAAPGVTRLQASVTSVFVDGAEPTVQIATGEKLQAPNIVIAAGAWAPLIAGVPLLKAVAPGRGQLVSFAGIGLRHVVYGPRGYLVPRAPDTTLAGSTMENAGYDSVTTAAGIARVRSAAEEIAPALAVSPVRQAWAGLRPVTPDLLPILGRDPVHGGIIYACGHSRNGILLAPLTGDVVAQLVAGETPAADLSQFRPDRF